jgi:hypothetical protein
VNAWTALSAFALLGAACSNGHEQPPQHMALSSAVYRAWDEEIRVDADAMTILHTQTQFEYADPTSAVPASSRVEKLLEGKVTPEDVEALAKFIGQSRVMDLKPQYGAPEGERHYPYGLEVRFRGGELKKVEFRSNPAYGDPPEAFQRFEKHLKDLSDAIRKR